MYFFIFVAIVSTLSVTPALGTSYNYHPSTPIYLGSGLNPIHPDQAFRNCLESDGIRKVSGSGAMNTYFSVNLIKSRKELFEQLQISASLSARSAFWSGSASANYFSEHRFHSDSLTWIIKGTTDYGSFALDNPRLKSFAQQLLDSNKHEQFAKTCGLEFINQERRAVLIAAVFSMENVSQEQKKQLEVQFQASYNAPFLNADLKAKYANFFQDAARTSRISMTIYAVGGSGITTLAPLVSKLDNLDNIQLIIQSYMAGMTEQQAVPLEYFTGSMTAFGWHGQTPIEAFRRERILGELFHRYTNAENTYRRIESIIDNRNSAVYQNLNDTIMEEYRANYSAYGAYLNELLNIADLCYENFTDCRLPEHYLPRIKWPIDVADNCERIRLQAFSLNQIDDEELAMLRKKQSMPFYRPNGSLAGFISCAFSN